MLTVINNMVVIQRMILLVMSKINTIHIHVCLCNTVYHCLMEVTMLVWMSNIRPTMEKMIYFIM